MPRQPDLPDLPDLPALGTTAPPFRVTDVTGAPITGADLLGRPALLVFFPFAFSGVCTSELTELSAALPQLAPTRVLGISCDPTFSQAAWAREAGVAVELASDFWPHGATATAFGAFDESHGWAHRVSVLLDGDGVVRWRTASPPGRPRDAAEAVAAVDGLRAP
ncbi:alkyl hydroperoxide reductase/ Thiol specific antioxidant/ Mal allergen [Beutenbergia cavernae DSM 12333]|uniref:Alkyl hydroperoxide reductase/ Thiol specific antioxidant/ Mal allergen n=1 Tax=Beutenbergia cavernae (strain ATCC BAA-8 / DSM 12333 / CCUG 43141 / JCM 11478 / NBRC 16432 / NCIMB 13614 / HKI 0122) TaxID=471853 RepID=C5C4U0_BEUC1|nr:redoxin domain-containing protein [Beutenbergia cavernae]ACQ80068.1 alkyl hydroperoxide reductase/ Thiol specific antioxidant/ Mal allergen [Beutenbergia cavernae DSM 12333]